MHKHNHRHNTVLVNTKKYLLGQSKEQPLKTWAASCTEYVLFILRINQFYQPNIRFTLRHVNDFHVFGYNSPSKVNWFGWNLEHSEYIVRGWPWQILGAIHTVATAGERGSFFVRWATHNFTDFPSVKFHEICTQRVDQCRNENFCNRILKVFPASSRFTKKMPKFRKNF